MKKGLLIGICLIAVIGGILLMMLMNTPAVTQLSNAQSKSGEVLGGPLSYNIVLNTTKPDTPEKIAVYKTIAPKVTNTEAIVFAKKFNITDYPAIKESDGKITISSNDMRKRVMLYKNGGQYYVDYDRCDTPNGIDIAENLPSDEQAVKIAKTFLKERDLLPEGAIIGGVTHEKTYTTRNGKKSVSWEDIKVWYTREINGLKVEGTQFEVEVGGHGDIIRFFSNWKEYEPIGEYPIKTRDSSIDTLKQKGILTTAGPDKPDTISINEIYLAYDTTAVAYKESYLRPVYVFKGEALKNGTAMKPVKEFVPALTEESMKSIAS